MSVPNWEQNAKDAEQILCDSGDLLRECYGELKRLGSELLAEKVAAFCDRVCLCMATGKMWEEGRDRSDESDVQSAAILKEVKSRVAHRLTTWSSMKEREVMWCLLQLTETIEGMLQREVTKTNT